MGEARNADSVCCLWFGEFCWRAFRLATKQKLTDRGVMELILESDSNARSWDLFSSKWQCCRWHYWHIFTQWAESTHCWPAEPVIHRFSRCRSGLWQTEAPYVTEDYTTLSVCMLFFCEVILLLVEERNMLSPLLDMLDKWWSPLPGVTVQEMYLFLAIIVLMRHIIGILLK